MAIIRAARPEDAAALAELARAAYSVYVERMAGTEPAPMRDDYPSLVDSGQVWVAEHDAAVVGMLVLKLKPDHVQLNNLAVSPARQGTGLGKQLLDFTDAYAREHGRAEVRLYTNEAMTENLAYYPRHGFRETHRGVENGYHRVYFAKDLSRV
ncbi:GNAT family N-acetyltransferase [Amycolatopsis silviterrae]|uniref:GNAT family N-acetyltransferase n=1 Tax=Amycolatopsis silviterrae TaxID=1656914 RepID=A0ABW5HC52_9PSEU